MSRSDDASAAAPSGRGHVEGHGPIRPSKADFARVSCLQNDLIGTDTYRLRFAMPSLVERFLPGQFVMIRLAALNDPLLGRAFAVYDVGGSQGISAEVDVVYTVIGKMTGLLARCTPGDSLEVWGPLGNGFPSVEVEHLILVAGGIGQTPLLAPARAALGRRTYGTASTRRQWRAERVTLCFGAKTGGYLAGVDDFSGAGVDVRLATDDGSVGTRGLVTELLQSLLEETAPTRRHIFACGPSPMLAAVAQVADQHKTGCHVSLEESMACGVGACFSCVARIRDRDDEQAWDYRRTCVDGPVFDARDVVF